MEFSQRAVTKSHSSRIFAALSIEKQKNKQITKRNLYYKQQTGNKLV